MNIPIVIEVRGGVVQDLYYDPNLITSIIIDWDNLNAGSVDEVEDLVDRLDGVVEELPDVAPTLHDLRCLRTDKYIEAGMTIDGEEGA